MNYANAQMGSQTVMGCTAEREPEIRSLMTSLDFEVNDLAALISSVEQKFSPVIQPAPPMTDGANALGVCKRTPHGEHLSSLIARVSDARARMISLLDRAEL